MNRQSGILLPIFSLPGKYGIGCFSKEAYSFADFLKRTGQQCWQILPLGPTGYGDSPYQSFSTFAGNPYFISLEMLMTDSLLTEEECCELSVPGTERCVDYGLLYNRKIALLKKACARCEYDRDPAFIAFCEKNAYWLDDYSLFMALKEEHDGRPFDQWEPALAAHEESAVAQAAKRLQQEMAFYRFVQFEFDREWKKLREYVNSLGIRIIGDIPIYVSADSADFWAHRDLFMLDERGRIRMVAGVPPDGFSADGQLWGNPLYDWPHHKETGYDWWKRRIGKCLELYDIIRIDHFRGFDEFFAVPATDSTAANGHWEKGPGLDLFQALEQSFGKLNIIAEDLGYVTDTVRKLVRDTGFPNMKVLEFAFDSRDSTGAAEYLPYTYGHNCVVYTGTHDNETVRGWLDSILPEELAQVKAYLGVMTEDPQEIVDKMIRMAQGSVADLCVIPLQDYLGLDNSARINQPSTFGTNWQWRMRPEDLTDELEQRILGMTRLYGRA